MNNGILKYGIQNRTGVEIFSGSAFNALSFCCTPIELLANDGSDSVISTATGFFWQINDQPYLITNWHVISGRNPFTGDLNSSGYIPTRLKFYGLSVSTNGKEINFSRRAWALDWNDELSKKFEKPPNFHDQAIDIWAIPIQKECVFGRDASRTGFNGSEFISCFVNDYKGDNITTNVSDDCFILGYPLTNYDGLMPPIWKRGSIASETPLGIDGRPIFLVDAATTPGMSGSPIFRKITTLTAKNVNDDLIQEFSSFKLIGVYAGRLENKSLERVNIGYGWHCTMINAAIAYYGYQASNLSTISTNYL